MIDSTVTGHGRFYDLGGAAGAPVFGNLFPGLAGEHEGPWVGGVQNTAHWDYEVTGYPGNPGPYPPGVSGLLQAIPDLTHGGQRILGIQALGTGTLNFDIDLSPGGVWVGFAGEVITVSASVSINGAIVQQQDSSVAIPGWVVAHFVSFHFVGTIDVVAGDSITAGILANKTPAIYAYSSGTGFGTRMFVSGYLEGEGEAPGQPPMRFHGAVAADY